MTETTEDRRAGLLKKIRGLLDTADSYESTGNSAAAQTYREKADSLIAIHTINEFELMVAGDPNRRYKPESRDYEYGNFPVEIRQELIGLFGSLARHCGVRLGLYRYDKAVLVGYPEDMDYLDLLFTSVRLHMSSNVRPSVNPNLSYEENLATLKECGMKWRDIYLLLLPVFPERFENSIANVRRNKRHKEVMGFSWNSHHTWDSYEGELIRQGDAICVGDNVYVRDIDDARGIGVRFTKEYTEFCEATGRERIKADPTVWLRSFVDGYGSEIADRLYYMQKAREKATEGKGLVMVSMADEINELLYQLFPEKRPHAPDCDCEACHRCSNPKCKRSNCVARRKPVRYKEYKAPTISAAGRARGRQAGAAADLSGGRNNLGGNKGEIG